MVKYTIKGLPTVQAEVVAFGDTGNMREQAQAAAKNFKDAWRKLASALTAVWVNQA